MAKKPAVAASGTSEGKDFDEIEVKGEKIIGVARVQRLTEADMAPPEVDQKAQRAATLRQAEIAVKVQDLDVPDSMRTYMIVQSLPDETIDAMAAAWKRREVVEHGVTKWGESKP